MDQQPKIPTLKDSQKPQVKVRGMSIGLTLAERLKQFKKKDLAFILAGLGVLFMAPLAEHFMMAPETADGTLQAGWKGGSGSNGSGANGVFGAGGSPYDRTDGLAPGSPTGGGSDVITPLNVRDPSALVMGPGGTQQPPTNSALPSTPPVSAPSARSDSDLKDALAASARGVGAAAKRASLPVPKVALGGSGLRGLSVAGGGSSSSASLGPISAGSVPNKAAGGDSTGNARAMKGFQGVTRGQSSGGSGLEALKAAAGKQAENMNRGTGAASDLNAAAQTAIPTGGDGRGGGGPGGGKDDKGIGGNQDKGSKTIGESLDFINKKERMQKDLELEYKKKEANDMGLLWSNMRNEGLKTVFGSFAKGIGDGIGSCVGNFMKGGACIEGASGPVGYSCTDGTGFAASALVDIKACRDGKTGQFFKRGGGQFEACPSPGKMLTCSPIGGKDPDATASADTSSVDNAGNLDYGSRVAKMPGLASVGTSCTFFTSQLASNPTPATAATGGVPATSGSLATETRTHYMAMQASLKTLASARTSLTGAKEACGSNLPDANSSSIIASQSVALSKLDQAAASLKGSVASGSKDVKTTLAAARSMVIAGSDASSARTQFSNAQTKIATLDEAEKMVTEFKKLGQAEGGGETAAYTKAMADAEAARKDVVSLIETVKKTQTALQTQLENAEKIVDAEGTFPKVVAQNDNYKDKLDAKVMEKKDEFEPKLALKAIEPIKTTEDKSGVAPDPSKSTDAGTKITEALTAIDKAKPKKGAVAVPPATEPPLDGSELMGAKKKLELATESVKVMREYEYGAISSVVSGVKTIRAEIKDGKAADVSGSGGAPFVPFTP